VERRLMRRITGPEVRSATLRLIPAAPPTSA
jgi:hypothetical protein